MDSPNSNDDNLKTDIIQSLNLDFGDNKNEEENEDFNSKMKSLYSQLETQLDAVKKYANLKMPLEYVDLDLSPYNISLNNKFKYNFDNVQSNFKNNENFIEINNINNKNNENDEIKLKQNNNNKNNDEFIKINEYKFGSNENTGVYQYPDNINEIKSNSIRDSQDLYINIQNNLKAEIEKKKRDDYQKKIEERKEEEDEEEERKRKEKEEIIIKIKEEEERIKKEEEESKRKEEEEEERIRKKEEERIRKEEEERKRKEEEERIKKEEEERKRKEEEEEQEQRDRLLKEEYDRLKKEEKEKEEEEKRENERIKKERLLKEKLEKEAEEKKKIEEEKKKELERKKKEEELQQEKELKEQIKKQKQNIEEDEVKVMEVDDDDVEELEEEVSYTETSNFRSRIKQSITKSNVLNSNLNSINNDFKDGKFKSQIGPKSINPGVSLNPKLSTINENEANDKNKSININNINNKNKNKSINKSNNPNKLNNKSINQSKLGNSNIKKSQLASKNNAVKKPKQQKEPEKDIQSPENINNAARKFLSSEIYKKLDKEKGEQILKYINNVENFDIKNPDLDGINSFTYINEFEKDEKTLSELIPKFEDKIIKKYNGNQLENKVKDFLSDDTFKQDVKSDELLTDILAIPNESHMELLKKNYEKDKLKNLPSTDPKEANNLQELEDKFFSEEELLPEFNSAFSKLENLQTFIYKYSVHDNPKLMGNAINIFNYWRMTLGDGNSFYRINMFAIIENCILESKAELLGYILNEMTSDKFIEIYKLKKINYEKPFQILSVILMMIENGFEEKAYEFFLKSYSLKDRSFDMLLIIYLKRVLYNFGEEINKLLDEKKKTSEDIEQKLIERTKINLEEIDNLYLEPKLNIFYLISSLFEINIKVFLVTGDFLNAKDSLKTILNDEEEPLPTFIFGYFFSSYHILYESNINNEIFKNTIIKDNPKITQLLFPLKDNKKCDICCKNTKHLVFLRKKFIICTPCLSNYAIFNILKERKSQFFDKKCFGSEYYSRPIHIQGDFYLDDYEFIELFEDKNIISELSSIVKCSSCDLIKNSDINLITLKCGCTYCEKCFETIIKNLTNGHGYLLECEYQKSKHKFECGCKKIYTYKDLENYYERDDEQYEEAKKRMNEYIKTKCMICFKNLKKEKGKKIKMRKDCEIQEDHFMCESCYNKYFKQNKITITEEDDDEEENENEDETKEIGKESESNKQKTKKKSILKADEQKIYCNICSNWHNYKDEGGSCACIIY